MDYLRIIDISRVIPGSRLGSGYEMAVLAIVTLSFLTVERRHRTHESRAPLLVPRFRNVPGSLGYFETLRRIMRANTGKPVPNSASVLGSGAGSNSKNECDTPEISDPSRALIVSVTSRSVKGSPGIGDSRSVVDVVGSLTGSN